MDRLTWRTDAGTANFNMTDAIRRDNIARSAFYQKACISLAAYEDIGLTPEQVQEMAKAQKWIPVSKRLPEAEERVLVLTETRCADGRKYRHITTGMYEDGTVWREESDWNFNDLDNYDTYDEERDDWKIPEGWWEYTIYNDDEGNYPIDDFVTHWMPLPQLPKEREQNG